MRRGTDAGEMKFRKAGGFGDFTPLESSLVMRRTKIPVPTEIILVIVKGKAL